MQLEPEEAELPHAVAVRRVDQIVLDLQIVADEVGGIGLVREDAADLGRSHEHVLGPALSEEAFDRRLIAQVEHLARRAHEICVVPRAQRPHDRGTDEAALARDEDGRVAVHSRGLDDGEAFARDQRVALRELQVRVDHLADELLEADLGAPTELAACLRSVAE